MSQYPPSDPQYPQQPSPQIPSPYYLPGAGSYLPYAGGDEPTAPAKRASLLMFLVSLLLLTCGGCFMSIPAVVSSFPPDQARSIQPRLDQIETIYHQPISVVMPIFGAAILLPGLVLLILAFFVRRGSRIASILSMVVVGLIMGSIVIGVPNLLMHAMSGQAAMALCMDVGILSIFGLLFTWLLAVAKSSSSISRAQQQYLAQYWQYQQNMQAYSHQNYGYAAPQQAGQSFQSPAIPPTPQDPQPPI